MFKLRQQIANQSRNIAELTARLAKDEHVEAALAAELEAQRLVEKERLAREAAEAEAEVEAAVKEAARLRVLAEQEERLRLKPRTTPPRRRDA